MKAIGVSKNRFILIVVLMGAVKPRQDQQKATTLLQMRGIRSLCLLDTIGSKRLVLRLAGGPNQSYSNQHVNTKLPEQRSLQTVLFFE